MSKKVSDRLRSALNFVNCGVCGCHRNKEIRRTMDQNKTPIKRTSKRISKDNFAVISSADEKLRSLGHKTSNTPKSNTYCGPQSLISETGSPTTRSEPPDVPPPPVPKAASTQSLPTQPNYSQQTTDATQSTTSGDQYVDEETAPPLFPRTVKSEMAERRVSNYNKRDSDERSAKRRSRSEGPHGRRRTRNSMHETSSTKTTQSKTTSQGRHSMYTGNHSDEDIGGNRSGSLSDDTEDDIQKWTKNPLLVKRSRKSDRNSKTENRKSLHSLENGFSKDSRGYSPSRGQKAKFQRMEANRRKRIEMAVTSDEECSPQLRISRLRQRAMLSSKLFEESSSKNELNIVPETYDNALSNGLLDNSANDRHSRYDDRRVSQYSEHRHSKFDENDNVWSVNGSQGFRQIPVQSSSEKVKTNQIKLPEYLPIQHEGVKIPVQIKNTSDSRSGKTSVSKTKTSSANQSVDRDNVITTKRMDQSNTNRNVTRVKVSSESPKLRSFQEVRSSQPAPMKKAVGKIELNARSVNSSSDDSLDELIESNIQYLESEIESGKLKRQSGTFTNAGPDVNVIQRKVLREPVKKQLTIHDEFRSRLQAPGSFSTPALNPPQFPVTRVNVNDYVNPVPQPFIKSGGQSDHRHIPTSGSATYSPHMKRRTYEYNEDISRSDTQLNIVDARFIQNVPYFPPQDCVTPYPVLNTQTGNIVYIQPEVVRASNLENKSLSAPSMDAGMFSDVEYNIEVSERIKKWEKKISPAELEAKQRNVLKTIQEYESFGEGAHGDKSVPDTPVEIRRELRQLISPTDTSGLGKLSVNLTRSTSSVSDSATQESGPAFMYYEPKVVSSETNLHRIFRVVHEPKAISTDRSTELTPASSTASFTALENSEVQRRKKNAPDQSHKKHAQSLGHMALSESELGNTSQQTWPPMSVDSDSGIRKSWRMSRYEDEINELKELVADNFRDLRKRFDSDVSETDTRRGSSPARIMTVTPSETPGMSEQANMPVTLSIQAVTPTRKRSPAVVRRAVTKKQEVPTPPVSPTCPPLTPKFEKKPLSITVGSRATPPISKSELKTEPIPPDVWSPSMESGKGLISIERVKARTLQTIPFSEDPVWKEIEGLTTFDKSEESPSKISFDDIDALLELATKGAEKALASNPRNVMTTSFSPSHTGPEPFASNQLKHRKLSDSALAMPDVERRKAFNPPKIQPLKLSVTQARKTSTSALDEVLEDIRASLQKKPLSPKLLKNVDATESNSSANTSLRSPLTKSSKAFLFSKEAKPLKSDHEFITNQKQDSATPGYDNAHASWQQQPATNMQQSLAKQVADMAYVDPEFTQFPYIINGNYHLDPDLLSEKLISTGLVANNADLNANNQTAFNKSLNNFQSKQTDNVTSNTQKKSINTAQDSEGTKRDFKEIDQSVMELRNLAQEVENKLSQIKSRIVSADGAKLDSILLALRKFAPMTEQKFFNVNFTPSYDPDSLKRGKLEDALTELEKIYESLNLDDKNLMDRAAREEGIPESFRAARSDKNQRTTTRSRAQQQSVTSQRSTSRKSHIEEVERQTQNEFEDITKSFQVLLDEVTKQCKSVARGSVNYIGKELSHFPANNEQYSAQPPANVIHHEPPRQQLRHGSQSQRDIQESYNVAIKELESVATGTSVNLNAKPVQSSVFVNLDTMNPTYPPAKHQSNESENKQRSNGINIKLQSRENVPERKHTSNSFVSKVTEFKPTLATSVNLSRDTSSSESDEIDKRNVVKRGSKSSNGKMRFRRKGNPEHRKSMPAAMRTVETQTIETQTDASMFEQEHNKIANGIANDNETRTLYMENLKDDLRGFPVKRKLSTGIAKIVDLFSSSEDEFGKGGKLKHSHSAPDIVDLCEGVDNSSVFKTDKVDKQSIVNSAKGLTPRSVKSRHESKARFRSLQKGDTNLKRLDLSVTNSKITPTSVTSPPNTADENMTPPISKPPVYPVWQYPGKVETPSPKKIDKRPNFGFERDFHRNFSDTETDNFKVISSTHGTELVRRRTRSVGAEEDNERPKSFHELMAAFESDPERLEKIRTSGLRKCASEESMFIDLVLQKMYPSASSSTESRAVRRSSETKMTLTRGLQGNN